MTDAELDDTTEETSLRHVRLNPRLVASPTVLGAIGGVALGFTVLLWPNRTDRILARLIGLILAWFAITLVVGSVRRRDRVVPALGIGVVGVAIGSYLVLRPDRSATFLGVLLGLSAITSALWRTIGESSVDRRRRPIPNAGSIMLFAVGGLLLVFPDDALSTVTVTGAVGCIALSGIVVVASLDARDPGAVGYRGATSMIRAWVEDRPKSVDARQSLYDKILYEGPGTQQRIIRFFVLMAFAAVIASMGVVTDSTAVVIGAMLIAPLMTPLMGMAMSLVMGWPNRFNRSALIALGGITFAIAIGVLFGLIVPAVIDTSTNEQIVARSAPTVLDLITALAAGAAGAYGLSRPDVSDSLPGVAIAISLVPPLSVVGIAYSQGDWNAGHGAVLLFSTNMLAILVMGGITFIVTGVTPISRAALGQQRMRTAIAGIAVLGALVLGSLFLNGTQAATNLLHQGAIDDTVDRWLEDGDLHRLVSVTIDDDTVMAVVVGPSDGLPPPANLAAALSDELGRTITVDVRLIVEERIVTDGS